MHALKYAVDARKGLLYGASVKEMHSVFSATVVGIDRTACLFNYAQQELK